MDFWLISAVITGLVVAGMVLAATRRGGVVAAGNDMQVYRDQLKEVERDVDRGVLGTQEADRLRLEVSRRLLDADRRVPHAVGSGGGSSPILAGAVVLAVFGGAFWVYGQLGSLGQRDLPLQTRIQDAETMRLTRMGQAEAETMVSSGPLTGADPAHVELIAQLRVALKSRPDDLQGHELLVGNEAGLGNFILAYQAQLRVIEIKGVEATANDFANYADLLALAANGYVSPEAEAAVRQVLNMDPTSGTGRYYLGLLNAQIGRADIALGVWRKLLADSIPDAPWVPPIRAQIELVAAEAGVRYELPALGVGPSAADVAAAQDMTAEDQDTMIRAMVEQLSARLAEDGGSAQEWARLIGALGVLGDTDRAATTWAEAQSVFAASSPALVALRQAAERAGIAN